MSEALFAAIERHNRIELTKLLQGGADPNAQQSSWPGLRPLHAAVHALENGGSLDSITALLDHGADINGWDARRVATPLLAAIADGQRAAVEVLLRAGADPNVRSSEGDSPLRICVATGDSPMAALLLKAGANKTINEWGGIAGYTALGLAAFRLDLPMLKLLLEAGADPEAPDEDAKPASDRLPPRDDSNAAAWDAAFRLLHPSP